MRREPGARRFGARTRRREPGSRRAGHPRDDAAGHGAGGGARAVGHEAGDAAFAAGAPSRPRRRIDQGRFGAPEPSGSTVRQGELGQRRGTVGLAAPAVLRGDARRAARRLAEGQRSGQEVPVVDPDAVLAKDRHRQIELGDVVDVDPQACPLLDAESGDPGAEPAVLPEQLPAGPYRPRIELAHEPPVQLQDGEDLGIEDQVQGRGLVIVQAGRGRCGEAVQDQGGAELVAHDRRHLARLLHLALLALHPGRDAHHDDDDEHRDTVREDVDEGDAGEIGHAPERAGHGARSDHGDCSA